ncbi:hypothetical protein EJB05_24430, partial [Eragrostis curvula]
MVLLKLFHISFLVLICTAKATIPESEALLQWKSTLIAAKFSWSPSSPTCSWFGVTCDTAGHVTKLHLSNAGVNGTLHSFYSPAFQNLTKLYLDNNDLTGAIPANISLTTAVKTWWPEIGPGVPGQCRYRPEGHRHLTRSRTSATTPPPVVITPYQPVVAMATTTAPATHEGYDRDDETCSMH